MSELARPGSAGVPVWLGLSALLGGFALLGGRAPRELLDWQLVLAPTQPWRSLSAVAVHYSAAHLIVNLVGTGLVAALGWAARITARMGVAWAIAWPLTHIGLLVDPQLTHYGGLSGVLHAGVAIAAIHLIAAGDLRRRGLGAAIGVGLLLKVASEFPWSPVLHAELGITVAPLAHLSGLVVGLACGLTALWLGLPNSRRPRA